MRNRWQVNGILGLVAGKSVLILMIALGGCYYDVQEELNPAQGSSCDTSNVGFAKDVQPLLEANCFTCHSANVGLGGVVLEGYENVTIVAENGKLAGAVNHESGFSPMPQNAPQLSECNLAKINKWINDGAPDN